MKRLVWISAQLAEQNLTGEAQPGRAGARGSPGPPTLPGDTPALQMGPGGEDRDRAEPMAQRELRLPQTLHLRVLQPARVQRGQGSAHTRAAVGLGL